MSLLDVVRRPEYTGDRRCWPCTVINSVFLVFAVGLVALVSVPVAVAVLVIGGAAIGLRGYLVPYTPVFAPKLIAPLPFDLKGVSHNSDTLGPADVDGEDVMFTLMEHGVLVGEEELGLAPEFEANWKSTMEVLRGGDMAELAAAAADAAPFEAEGKVREEWIVVDGDAGDAWLTEPIAIAETAAVGVLDRYDVPEAYRAAAAAPLRMFLTTCPVCGGDVVESTYRDCCGGSMSFHETPETDVLACEECDAIVYEFREPAEATEE